MSELKGTVSTKLVETIRFYLQHKVSGLQLVANYCQYNKHGTQIEEAFNPWVEFEQAIKGKANAVEGISIAESTFNLVEEIRNEKMLLFASHSTDPNTPISIFFTQCDKSHSNLIIEKEYIQVSPQQLKKSTTLVKLRATFERTKIDPSSIKHRKRPSVYQFSNEISLLYTVHRDKYNVYVGEAYYRGKASPENTEDGKVWNSPATQKGLRCKDQESVIGRMESVTFLDSIYPYIVGDVLDYYNERIGHCSLKTIWFCCRSRLLARRDYRDEIARNILFSPDTNALSALCPANASDEDYRNAMRAVIPEDSIAVVKYWQQLNIIMKVAEEERHFHLLLFFFAPLHPDRDWN